MAVLIFRRSNSIICTTRQPVRASRLASAGPRGPRARGAPARDATPRRASIHRRGPSILATSLHRLLEALVSHLGPRALCRESARRSTRAAHTGTTRTRHTLTRVHTQHTRANNKTTPRRIPHPFTKRVSNGTPHSLTASRDYRHRRTAATRRRATTSRTYIVSDGHALQYLWL